MNFNFSQIAPEVGVRFGLPAAPLQLLCDRLNRLEKQIGHFREKFGGEDYSVVFLIVPTRTESTTQARGPIYLKKRREIEFAVWIPHRESVSFTDKINYVFRELGKGIVSVFERYAADSTGIEAAIEEVAEIIERRPEDFQPKP